MARKAFDVIDIVEVLTHRQAGRLISVIAESLGTDRKTVRKYIGPAEAADIIPGLSPPLERSEWAELVREWFPDLVDPRARSRTFARIDSHRELIETNTVATVHQRLRDEHGLCVGVSGFRRYVWLEFPEAATHGEPRKVQ